MISRPVRGRVRGWAHRGAADRAEEDLAVGRRQPLGVLDDHVDEAVSYRREVV